MKDEFYLVPRIESIRRLGRPSNDKSRQLLIKVNDERNSTRQLTIRRSKELRQSNHWNNIFIVPDQTPNERELGKKLREELKTRRSAGETNLTIRRCRIISVNGNKTRENHGATQSPPTQKTDQGELWQRNESKAVDVTYSNITLLYTNIDQLPNKRDGHI